MSAAPQLHYSSDTDLLPGAYNSAAEIERPLEVGMTEPWKQWQGHAVNGEFPLQRYLGGSDHSAVFLTECTGSQAAIKLISADPETAEAQLSRWRLAARLSHPNLLSIFTAGRATFDSTDLLYVVTEFADDNLAQILPQRALTDDEAREMVKPVAQALAYVHREQCVHGRLQPSNILAVGDQIKLSSDSLSASGEMMRVKRSLYDAPESASGIVSPAADVWSLGVTLVEALTQRLPDHTGSGPAILPAGVREPFHEIARHALYTDPQKRWTVRQIAACLEPTADPVPLLAAAVRPATPKVAAAPAAKRSASQEKKAFAAWLYVIPIIVAALVAWVLISGSRTMTAPPPDQPFPLASPRPQTESPSTPQPSPATPSRVTPARSLKKSEPATDSTSASAKPANSNIETATNSATSPAPPTAIKASASIPGVVRAVMPSVSARARRTITGMVRVRVRVEVDTNGNVTSAVLDSSGPSKYFARLSKEAAQQWRFAPAQVHGQFVPSQWTLFFGFTRNDTKAAPQRIAP